MTTLLRALPSADCRRILARYPQTLLAPHPHCQLSRCAAPRPAKPGRGSAAVLMRSFITKIQCLAAAVLLVQALGAVAASSSLLSDSDVYLRQDRNTTELTAYALDLLFASGAGLRSIRTTSAEECAAACREEPQCAFFNHCPRKVRQGAGSSAQGPPLPAALQLPPLRLPHRGCTFAGAPCPWRPASASTVAHCWLMKQMPTHHACPTDASRLGARMAGAGWILRSVSCCRPTAR